MILCCTHGHHCDYPAGVTDRMVFDLYTDHGPQYCAICGVADPKHLTNIGSAMYPEDWCDDCLVANAESCGDWTNESTAAQRRLMPNRCLLCWRTPRPLPGGPS